MSGRDYAGATVYYIDYSPNDKSLHENCRIIVRESAVTYLKTTGDSTAAKVKYLKSLTHHVSRPGTNHKYQCNLNAEDISYIIRSVHDDELYLAYFGKMVTETPNDRKKAIISASVIVLFFFFFTIFIASING